MRFGDKQERSHCAADILCKCVSCQGSPFVAVIVSCKLVLCSAAGSRAAACFASRPLRSG